MIKGGVEKDADFLPSFIASNNNLADGTGRLFFCSTCMGNKQEKKHTISIQNKKLFFYPFFFILSLQKKRPY